MALLAVAGVSPLVVAQDPGLLTVGRLGPALAVTPVPGDALEGAERRRVTRALQALGAAGPVTTLRHQAGATGPWTGGPPAHFGGPCPDPDDCDGDGLPNAVEEQGWTIVIDEQGYGPIAEGLFMTLRDVTCDPLLADTDGDGIDDLMEYVIGTDPRSVDTDGDLLGDFAEWNVWFSNANSVDSDGDARGPAANLPPDPFLFDWVELDPGTPRTSPTLADTDGDGRTDWEELGHPIFHPLVSELPVCAVEAAGAIDVRLDVQYEQSIGGATSYEVTLTESTSTTHGTEETDMISGTASEMWEVGGEVGASFADGPGGTATWSYGQQYDTTNEHSFTVSEETSKTAEQAHSSYSEESTSNTETAASGAVSLPIRLVNEGDFSFTVTDLGITLLKLSQPTVPGEGPALKSMGTLVPDLPAITLAPGEASSILDLSADDLNADVIKEFLANPASLVIQPSQFNLLDANGLDFDFITETTWSRTAVVEINQGGGEVQAYRVATNVEREGFAYPGIPLGEVLTEILDLDYTTAPQVYEGEPVLGGGQVLTRLETLDGLGPVPDGQGGVQSYWLVLASEGVLATALSGDDLPPDVQVIDFESLRLHHGDYVQLHYVDDADGDGVPESIEDHFATDDDSANSDTDLLSDYEEILQGWVVGEGQATTVAKAGQLVFSDPKNEDTDGDGLLDHDEKAARTDPTDPDTDDDGFVDGVDDAPLAVAGVLFVTATGAGAGDGSSWDDAAQLQTAFIAAQGANLDGDPENDVAMIWVARGVHDHSLIYSFPRGGVQVLGGFDVGDTKLGDRDPDPFSNGTTIAGRLRMRQLEDGGRLDGFSFAQAGGQQAMAIENAGTVECRNLLISGFTGVSTPVDVVDFLGTSFPDSQATFRSCWFVANTGTSAGAVWDRAFGGSTTFIDCHFQGNLGTGEGGAYVAGPPSSPSAVKHPAHFTGCVFASNTLLVSGTPSATAGGAAASLRGLGATFENCEFVQNTATTDIVSDSWAFNLRDLNGGAVRYGSQLEAFESAQPLRVIGCRFWKNRGSEGAAIYIDDDNVSGNEPGRSAHIINCSIVGNDATLVNNGFASTVGVSSAAGFVPKELTELKNNVFWGNRRYDAVYADPLVDRVASCNLEFSSPILHRYAHNLINNELNNGLFGWTDVIELDPLLENEAVGNLRLGFGSPAMDTGFDFVDVSPEPGLQLLPPLDLDGNPRFQDGDGAGGAQVDRGAYEIQEL